MSSSLEARRPEHPNESAKLDPQPQVPWQDTFFLGCGVDALTGDPKPHALKDSTLKTSNHARKQGPGELWVGTIHAAHQQSRKNKFEVQGTVNPGIMSPLALGASFIIETSRVASHQSLLIETIVSGEHDFEKLDIKRLQLTSKAQALSETPEEFRKTHGDYFVCGLKCRYWFHALVQFRLKKVENDQKIGASIAAAWKNLLGVQVQAERNIDAFEFDENASAWVSHSGCVIIPTTGGVTVTEPSEAGQMVTGKDVVQMAKSILTTEQPGREEIALLVPYSRVLPRLPDKVPVSREVFDKLHDLEAKAFKLLCDCLHPAFEEYEKIVEDAKTAVRVFRRNRASIISDITAIKDAERSLDVAAGEVHTLLVRYQFMENLVTKWRGTPQIGETFKEKAKYKKWPFGVVSTDEQDTPQVSLMDGIVAFRDKLEGEIRDIPFANNDPVRVVSGEQHSQRMVPDPSNLIVNRPPYYIVGWTLSIKTKRPGTRTFSVISGGILENNLTIRIKAPAFQRAYWRCRIYLVEKALYNFPHLTSK